MANRDRNGDAEGWPYRFDERDGSVDRYAGGTRGNARDDYQGSGVYGGSYTAGGRAGAGYGGGYCGYDRQDADRDRETRAPRPGFAVGWGGNVGGYGRGGALDYGYGGMNVGGRDRDWGLGDVPHLPNERYGSRWSEGHDEPGGGYGEGALGGTRRRMMGGGYGGAQTRGGRGIADTDRGTLSGTDYGRSWGGGEAGADDVRVGRVDHTGEGPRGYRRSDVRINEEVCDALMDDAELDASEIEVRVEAGEVTLTGTVTERRSKRLAEDIAYTVRGVWDVHNRLKIRKAAESGASAGQRGERTLTHEAATAEAPAAEGRRKRR